MKKIYKDLLDRIPEYETFLTLEELDASTHRLHQEYPDCTEVFEIGKTREGRPLLCLKITGGEKNALMFGCPHPNEPIGVMMLEYFTWELAKNPELRTELGFTWYIVKAWDADGLEKNKGWLKGPFTITEYSKHFFRPAMKEQVDWTFPVDYKDLHFHDTLPETRAMMELIDKIRPTITYSLHNAGFGGVYWYVTHDKPELYDEMAEIVKEQKIPIHLGEPESPFLKEFSPAVYCAEGIWQCYDYMEANGVVNIPEVIGGGTCSDDYSKQKYDTFTLLTEMPYFYDSRIEDRSLSNFSRGEVILKKLENHEKDYACLTDIIEKCGDFFSFDNPYILAIRDFAEEGEMLALKEDVRKNPKYGETATVAEVFDNSLINRFYNLLAYGMMPRAFEYEVEKGKNLEEMENLYRSTKEKHRAFAEMLESEFNYTVIPIKKLVHIQLACGLLMADLFR